MVAGARGQTGPHAVLTVVVEHEAVTEHVPTLPQQMAERIARDMMRGENCAIKT